MSIHRIRNLVKKTNRENRRKASERQFMAGVMDNYATLVERGELSPNQARKLCGLEPLADGDMLTQIEPQANGVTQ